MRTSNALFDTKNALDYKTPLFKLKFDGQSSGFFNHRPARCGSNHNPNLSGCLDPHDDQDNTTGWVAMNSAVLTSEDNGSGGHCLRITEGGWDDPYAYDLIQTYELGKKYTVTFKVRAGTETGWRLWIGDTYYSEGFTTTQTATGSWVEHSFTFYGWDNQANLRIESDSSNGEGYYIEFDDLAIYESGDLGDELLEDGGFEEWTAGDPDYWNETRGDAFGDLNAGNRIHGSYGCRFTVDGGESDGYIYASGGNQVIGGKYRYQIAVRLGTATSYSPWIHVDGVLTYPWGTNLTDTSWVVYRYESATPVTDESPLLIGCYFYGANGTGWLDSASIRRLESKSLIQKITGLSQKVTPEEGKSSIGAIVATIQDRDDEITALLATDSYYFHRKKVQIYAGYAGMGEDDLLLILTGWVTNIKMSKDLLSYDFTVTDPQKWTQRKIFRGSESSTVTISGNAINVLLAILTSTGAGTNGSHDTLAEENGLGIDDDFINVSSIEDKRDKWYPGDSYYGRWTITKRETAKDWLEREIFKVLNVYPTIDADGKFNITPFKPPLATTLDIEAFNNAVIDGLPGYDMNLEALINEVEFHYDYDEVDGEYDSELFYIDSTSLNNRGPGKKPLTIKSRGFHSDYSPGSMNSRMSIIAGMRKGKVFGRWSTPPILITLNCYFSKWLSEAGDIVSFSHPALPDVEAGTRGLSSERMEIISRQIDWRQGKVKLKLLGTGFSKGKYGVISPAMTITAGSSGSSWTVSTSDAAKYQAGWEARILDDHYRSVAVVTILTINTTTGAITSDNIGQTPANGWKVIFADYSVCTAAQQLYGFIYDAAGSMSEADLIVP